MIFIFGTRFFIEFFKEPQVGFEQSMALNMGQLLSIPFVLIGVAGLVIIYRKKKLPLTR
jgi:prolipoprotein diacylglyceryltransferase